MCSPWLTATPVVATETLKSLCPSIPPPAASAWQIGVANPRLRSPRWSLRQVCTKLTTLDSEFKDDFKLYKNPELLIHSVSEKMACISLNMCQIHSCAHKSKHKLKKYAHN